MCDRRRDLYEGTNFLGYPSLLSDIDQAHNSMLDTGVVKTFEMTHSASSFVLRISSSLYLFYLSVVLSIAHSPVTSPSDLSRRSS